VGTGLNAPAGFDTAFCDQVSALTGIAFNLNPSKFESMGAHDAFVEVSGAISVVAVSLTKIANDIRLLGSGPRCGLGELIIPHDGLTSSIMPGKRNPTIAEVVAQAAFAVIGNHTTISMAGAAGTFELNNALRASLVAWAKTVSQEAAGDGVTVNSSCRDASARSVWESWTSW